MFGWLSVKHGAARRALAVGAALCLLAPTLALGACGSAPQSQAASGTTSGATSGTTSVGGVPGGGMAVRPCPGLVGDATQVGAIALTLTPDHAAGSLHVGELAQVRLPAGMHWTLAGQPSGLASVGEAGGEDKSLNVCYWTFRAQSAGNVTLNFSGAPPCDPSTGPCSAALAAERFTITVS